MHVQHQRKETEASGARLEAPTCRTADASPQTPLQVRRAVYGCLLFALAEGCGDAPPLPNDNDHRDATVDECIECHGDGEGTRPPRGHFEDGRIKEKKQDCYGCHALPE
jgi:hypothetical protein